jgi:pentapeptide repeat protein
MKSLPSENPESLVKPKEGKALSQSPSDPQSANPPSASGASSQQPRSANELLAAYARGDRMFAHWNLTGADLKGATLTDANFFRATLKEANLSGADLTRCNFSQAILTATSLRGANISEAYFDNAVTFGADLTDTISDRPTPRVARPVTMSAAQTPTQPPSAVLSSSPSTTQGAPRTTTPASQNNAHAHSVPPTVRSSRSPTRTYLQTLGLGVLLVIVGIALPAQTEQCSTNGFGQYCIETVYTYNGVSAPVCKGFLIVVGILCFVVAGFLLVSRNTQEK